MEKLLTLQETAEILAKLSIWGSFFRAFEHYSLTEIRHTIIIQITPKWRFLGFLEHYVFDRSLTGKRQEDYPQNLRCWGVLHAYTLPKESNEATNPDKSNKEILYTVFWEPKGAKTLR